jgi:general secretion pathway protein I
MWKTARSGRNRSGYTLLELMVASAILAVGLTVVMRSFTAGIESLRVSEQRSVATILAQQRLAEIQALTTLEDKTDSGSVEPPWDKFRWQSEIRTMEQYPDLKQVRVVVAWRTAAEQMDDVTLTTVLRPPSTESETSQ